MYNDLFRFVKYVDPFATRDDIEELKEIDNYDLLIKFKNGDRVIFDRFEYRFRWVRYEDNNLTDEQYKKEFGKILRRTMQRKFITQEELAERVGVTRPMISRYINGDATPSYIMLIKLSKALDCSADDLIYKHF